MCMCASIVCVLCKHRAWGAPNPKGKVEVMRCAHSPTALAAAVTTAVLLSVITFFRKLWLPGKLGIYSRRANHVWILPLNTVRKTSHFICQVFLKEMGVCAPCVLPVTYSRSVTLSVLCSMYTVMILSVTLGSLHNTGYLIKIFPTLSEDALILSLIKHLLYDNYNVPLPSRFLGLVSHSKIALTLWLHSTE